MQIRILETISGARQASGLAVIIDVFRAFSLEPYLFARGAERIYAVGARETAEEMKKAHPGYILCGERKGVKLPGFDYGNSPSQTAGADLAGRTVVHTTSAGTQGLVAASGAEEIVTGALVNAKAVAAYIRERRPEVVSLVAMGLHGTISAPEDVLCARYIHSLLTGAPFDLTEELAALRKTESAERFFREENRLVFPREDYILSTSADCFDFVLKVEKVRDDVFEVSRCTPAQPLVCGASVSPR